MSTVGFIKVIVAGLLMLSAACMADISLPYADGFETNNAGILPSGAVWTTTGSNALVQGSETMNGIYACSVSNESALAINIDTNSYTYTNVWYQIYSKPQPVSDAPTVSSNETGAFYISTNGTLWAYTITNSADGWSNLVTGLSTNSWIGFAVHLDYENQTWDLYYTTDGYGTIMTRANEDPMSFHSAAVWTNEFASMWVTNECYVDEFAANVAYTNCGAAATNVWVAQRDGVGWTACGRPPRDYSGDDRKIGGALGDDLAQGLSANDEVRVYTNANGESGWNVYVWDGNAWDTSGGDADLVIGPAQGMWIKRTNANASATCAFYVNAGNPTVSSVTLGTNWNFCAWPYMTGSQVSAAGFDDASSGDKIYVYNNYLYDRLWWDGSAWKDGANNASLSLRPFQGFWYRNVSGSGETWDP